jgi:hypothetical protein
VALSDLLSLDHVRGLLAAWQGMPATELLIASLTTKPEFQPRAMCLVPYVDRGRIEKASEDHVRHLAGRLAVEELEPLLVADLGLELVLIDGHHRLQAYKLECRSVLPARVVSCTREEALLVSKLVNLGGAKLPMHPEQFRECAWQFLSAHTSRGKRPPAISNRRMAGLFGTSRETIGAMLLRLATVSVTDYGPEACDPGTGWPKWKYVKGNAIRDRFKDIPLEDRVRAADERRAVRIGKLIEQDGLAAFMRSLLLLELEELDELEAAAERLAQLAVDTEGDY